MGRTRAGKKYPHPRGKFEGVGRGKSTVPNRTVVETVRCAWCGAAKGEPCHRHTDSDFGIERGSECKPHPERWTLYRRWLKAQKLTRPLEPDE